MTDMMPFYVLYILFISVPAWTSGLFTYNERDIVGVCHDSCERDLRYTNEGGSQLFCDQSCSINQCNDGCLLYKNAVNSSCQKVCSSRVFNNSALPTPSQDQVRNCIQGCIFALDKYSDVIKDEIGMMDQPTLDISTLNYSSLVLKWKTAVLNNVAYKIQKRMIGMDKGWQLHDEAVFRLDGRIELTSLHPYVTYKFKVLAILSSLPNHIMYSNETSQITTLPRGAPSTAPRITSLSAPSSRVISLTWSPPLFTNGKLLSYRIYVEPLNHPILNATTIETPWNASSWLLSQLQSSHKYRISLSAWNAEGEGPKESRTITTPSPGNLSEHETAYLILGSKNKIIKRNVLDVIQHSMEYLDPIYKNDNNSVFVRAPDSLNETDGFQTFDLINGTVKDLGIHVRLQLIFASDSTGVVSKIYLSNKQVRSNHYPSIIDAGAITVDWLADRVYVASFDRIYSCPIDEDKCLVIMNGLQPSPTDLKVDPVNGFLYYVISGQGLFRVDLGDIQLSTPFYSSQYYRPKSSLVIPMADLWTHIIDLYNIHLYVVNNTARTMLTTFLDGSNMRPFHENVIRSEFSNVTSMIFYNQTFIWTNMRKMFGEEKESPVKDYRHNELLFFEPPFAGINVFHPSTQPIPVPTSAPDNVEALFSRVRADISWRPPPLLQYQGKGAWMNWTYELNLTRLNDQQWNTYSVSGLKYTVDKLLPNTEYSVQVRARSAFGDGPWSKFFIGKTLIDDNLRILLGLADSQIIQRNIIDDDKKIVVNYISNLTDIAWYEDVMLWVNKEGTLTVYNVNTQQKRPLKFVANAYCVAYDWLGDRVFWSDPNYVAIYRSDLFGIHVDLIRRSIARDLAIDSTRGRIYWATQNSIEASYLNGEQHQDLFIIPLFSGPNVISLTLDLNSEKVYWYVKASDSQSLYMANLITDNLVGQYQANPEKVGDFKSISSTSGLQYFAQRLFWLSETKSLMVGDLQCNFTATLSSDANITSFFVIPSGNSSKSKLSVIPNPIRAGNICTEGDWSYFNLTWSNATEVTHGIVFYKVVVIVGNSNRSFTTTKNWKELSGFSPYTRIGVLIQPYTYWGYADATTVNIRSPMSKPSAPLSPEVYVVEHKNATASYQTLAADFRWMSPSIVNGIISYHIVYYWMGEDMNSEKTEVKVKGTARNFILSPLVKNQTYHFKVIACTEAGCGPSSAIKTCVTNALNPVPKLLVATNKGFGITETDGDFTDFFPLEDNPARAITFLYQEELTQFWISKRNTVFETTNNVSAELFSLNGTGKDITTDWVSRALYIVESVNNGLSTITQYNIDSKSYTLFLTRSSNIQTVAADPFKGVIIWLEKTSSGEDQIMSADMNSGNVKAVISSSNPRRNKNNCNCPSSLHLGSAMAIAYSRIDGGIEILFADKLTGSIYSTDINGCRCSQIFTSSAFDSYGLPPSLMAVDHLRVSWYNQSEGKLYSVYKATGDGLTIQEFNGVVDIVALGSNLQPLPDPQCQDPGAASSTIQSYETGVSFIHLNLSAPSRPISCLTISTPQPKYTVYYRKVKPMQPVDECQSDFSQCKKMESYSTYMELRGLDPYTEYMIQAAVSNYFYPYLSEALSKHLRVRTEYGAPTPAREVISKPCTPDKIMVQWLPSLILNGPLNETFYRVQYSTALTHKETENIFEERNAEGFIQTFISGLEPGTSYSIKVLACMADRSRCNYSETVTVKTFMTPYNISFSNVTSHSITMRWRSPPDNSILRHQIIYAEVKPGYLKWTESGGLGATDNNTLYEEDITGLKPSTLYAFKITASYNFRPFDYAHYVWPSNDSGFTHKTSVFLPDEISTPDIRQLKSGLYEVKWDKPDDNGEPILNYELEISSALDPAYADWRLVYNKTETRWLVETKDLTQGKPYVFRVAAVNSEGRGAFSPNSSTFIAPHDIAEAGLRQQGTIGIIVGTVVVFLIVMTVTVACLVIQKRKAKTPHFIIRGPDTELATLRELPHTAFQQSNTLYAISIKCTDEEIAKLPHFSRNQLMLTMFLGSGAFGEVFEGLAKNILGDSSGETKCAVKTLRKSASDQEKEEFLKEALLMKNFQHDNILRLLGVCLDNDPQFIIMELMEGGDLLSFLRGCRATSTSPVKLLLPDLVKICVHVARGCRYLEDMHFVHRDLAARNCLVSSKLPSDMIVKIGDFGLARDIYKNDYYRKEGEGLLPVRWMSPESLVDGFFTTQSDIWAFGVLMWEVLTLGQQPYPARTNIEVLHFVRDGGKLERPEKCTNEMFALMQKCWSFNSDLRPSFAILLENLEIFLEKCLLMSPEEVARYSPAISDVNDDVNELMSMESEKEELIKAEEEEKELALGQFTPDKQTWGLYIPKVQTITGGGSVRLTQSGKQKRLKDLLGSPEGTEKLVVDLTKIGRKRTHSLEYSTKSSLDSSMDQFPAASNYDHHGYLEPRGSRNGPGYLELINYAPELRYLKDTQGNPLTIHPTGAGFSSVHVTRKGYHPSHVNYTLLSPDENSQTGSFSISGSDMCGLDDSNSHYKETVGHQYGSVDETPIYSRVCDDRRQLHSDSSGRHFGNSSYYLHPSAQSMEAMLLHPSHQRKYSDQDLYFSTAPYRQRQSSSSSSTHDHRYASVECNNNYSNPNKGQAYLAQKLSNNENSNGYFYDNNGRQRNSSSNSSHLYAKPGLGYSVNGNVSFNTIDDKSSHDVDDVFLDNNTNSQSSFHPETNTFNYHPQQNHILRSRGQVYPEHTAAFVGYDSNQVSLV